MVIPAEITPTKVELLLQTVVTDYLDVLAAEGIVHCLDKLREVITHAVPPNGKEHGTCFDGSPQRIRLTHRRNEAGRAIYKRMVSHEVF